LIVPARLRSGTTFSLVVAAPDGGASEAGAGKGVGVGVRRAGPGRGVGPFGAPGAWAWPGAAADCGGPGCV